ncbi:hypothetical protein M5K25_010303 [Dendrobium thyrsiflorum]|uniref:Retrovirus-related Pol polyprotein from transposon TNT 1-94 n=1 Tax=Dendrobium thyrsiflorum TaxID=117978 RepID=A0ABD0V026_DENTH
MAASSSSPLDAPHESSDVPGPIIPSTLKFLVANLHHLVPIQLSQENYAIWRSHILKIFQANGFLSFLDSSSPPLLSDSTIFDPSTHQQRSIQWTLTDQNLSAAMCSTISQAVLPYVLNLNSTAAIWAALQTRFQSTNRSKVIQLKNELHSVSLKNGSMMQYLSDIKAIVDQIAAAGSGVDTEDIILYILNGLPSTYQSFKTAIRTMLCPISLDQLYPLLISEEIHVAAEAAKTPAAADPNKAFFMQRGRGRPNRARTQSKSTGSARPNPYASVTCQICLKKGHSATSCWHRSNMSYAPSLKQSNTALLASSDISDTNWFFKNH